jgi:hypothetical protein
MKGSKISATKLRTVLVVLVITLVILSIGGFCYAQIQLSKLSADISIQKIQAVKIINQTDQQPQNYITNYQPYINKVDGLVYPDKDYQNQVKSSLSQFASDTDISITNYDFSPMETASYTAIAGINHKFIKVTFNNPAKFTDIMRFLKMVESNNPKMQMTGLSLGRVPESIGNVTVKPLIIGVYTK